MHIQNDVKESRKKFRECGEGMSAAEEALAADREREREREREWRLHVDLI